WGWGWPCHTARGGEGGAKKDRRERFSYCILPLNVYINRHRGSGLARPADGKETDDMSKTLTTGMDTYIRFGFAVCQTSVATIGISGTITNETEKAIEVTAYTKNDKPVRAWLPKKAIKALPVSKYAADLAPENTA